MTIRPEPACPVAHRYGFAYLLLAAWLGWTGCSSFTSSNPPVADSTMIAVLAEMHLAQARQKTIGDLTVATRDSILHHHDLDREQFEDALAFYAAHPEAYVEIYRQALDRLGEERMTQFNAPYEPAPEDPAVLFDTTEQ